MLTKSYYLKPPLQIEGFFIFYINIFLENLDIYVIMKYEIPQYKFKSVIFKFLNNSFDSYEKVHSVNFPLGYFYVLGDKIKAEVIPTHNALMLDWSLWNEVCDTFSFEYIKDVQKIVGEWAEDRFGMENAVVDLSEFNEDRYDL